LGDIESRAGGIQKALMYYRKALEVCKQWDASDHNVNSRSSLRGSYANLAGAQLITGDLYGARENYVTALRAVEATLRQADATVYEHSMLAAAHKNLGDILGNPDDLNCGDRRAAVSHYLAAIEIAEALAASDRQDVRARDDLAGAYRGLGTILLEEQPQRALKLHQQAAAISQEISVVDPSNMKYRRDIGLARMGIGECLYKLGRN
jgi:tetratricopeptide (TPR) repeat protein